MAQFKKFTVFEIEQMIKEERIVFHGVKTMFKSNPFKKTEDIFLTEMKVLKTFPFPICFFNEQGSQTYHIFKGAELMWFLQLFRRKTKGYFNKVNDSEEVFVNCNIVTVRDISRIIPLCSR